MLKKEYFYLQKNKSEEWEVHLRRKIFEKLMHPDHELQNQSIQIPTVWCPARYSVDGEPDVISEYSEWIYQLSLAYPPRERKRFSRVERQQKAGNI